MKISKIGAKVVEVSVSVFIGKTTGYMLFNVWFRCERKNLITKHVSIGTIRSNKYKLWSYS